MGKYLEQAFREAAENCKQCCEHFKNNPNTDNPYTAYAQAPLKKIMESYEQEDINWRLAYACVNKCNVCNYKSHRMIGVIESYGIKVS